MVSLSDKKVSTTLSLLFKILRELGLARFYAANCKILGMSKEHEGKLTDSGSSRYSETDDQAKHCLPIRPRNEMIEKTLETQRQELMGNNLSTLKFK